MTSWSAPGSPLRYFQCPFCARTFCSAYGEVFRRRAGARFVERPPAGAPSSAAEPAPTQEEIRWKELKRTADRWFARLKADERRCVTRAYAAAGVRGAKR